jgi:thymidine phosphorylase
MVNIGTGAGKKVVALITGMEQPLGYAVGNAVEVKEAIDTLSGTGPTDLVELVLELGSDMLVMAGIAASRSAARKKLGTNLAEKKGLKKLAELIQAQGGNPRVIENPALLPQPTVKIEVASPRSGFVEKIDALQVGMASRLLGAGRKTKDDPVDLSIGIVLKRKVGDRVEKGEPLAVFYSDGDKTKIDPAREKFMAAYAIGKRQVAPPQLFYARVFGDRIEKFNP